MKRYDYLIVGSGLTGAVFAHEAVRRGKSCLVVERREHIGGNLYCERIEGINVHRYGAHIFHTSNQKVWEFANRFTGFNRYINSPIANYRGQIYNLPFNMNTFSRMWGISTPAQAMEIIAAQRAEITGEPQNLEEQAINLVGRDVYEKLVKGYTEKQWGRLCRELPPGIITRLPVRMTYDNNYFDDRYQGIPEGGYNAMIERLLEGCDIRVHTDYLTNRETLDRMVDKIVYTGLIDEYYDLRFGAMEYRSLRFETEILDEVNYQGVAVVNYTDAETLYTRMIEHKHFEFGKGPKTVVTKEYPEEWKPGCEAYYPINDAKNQTLYMRYKALAEKEKSVLFCGRLATYQYYDMDDAIAAALATAEGEFS